jgi:hypothetical protein
MDSQVEFAGDMELGDLGDGFFARYTGYYVHTFERA